METASLFPLPGSQNVGSQTAYWQSLLWREWPAKKKDLKYWCFQFFVFGDHSVHCMTFSSIPAPYPLDTSSTPAPVVTTKNVSRHGNVPRRGGVMDISPVEKHWPIAMPTGKQSCPWGSIQLCSAFLLNISRQPKFTRYSRKNEEKKLLGGNRL